MSRTHAVVMAGPDEIIRHWDAGAEQFFGYTAAEAIGQSLDFIVPEEFLERHQEGFRNAVATRTCKLHGAAICIPVKCKDGTIEAFPARFVFLQGARGDVVGFSALYSERTGLETAFGPVFDF